MELGSNFQRDLMSWGVKWSWRIIFRGISGVGEQNGVGEDLSDKCNELGSKIELGNNFLRNLRSWGVKWSWGIFVR